MVAQSIFTTIINQTRPIIQFPVLSEATAGSPLPVNALVEALVANMIRIIAITVSLKISRMLRLRILKGFTTIMNTIYRRHRTTANHNLIPTEMWKHLNMKTRASLLMKNK